MLRDLVEAIESEGEEFRHIGLLGVGGEWKEASVGRRHLR